MTEVEEKKPSSSLNKKMSEAVNSFVAVIETLDAIDAYGKEQGYTREEMRDMVGPYLEEILEKEGYSVNDFTSLVDKILFTRNKQAPTNTTINNEYRLRRMLQASKKADK